MVRFIPTSLDEALEFISNHDAYIVAGGSDMMVVKRNSPGLLPKFDKDVIFVSHIKEIKKLYSDSEGLHIGAGVTLDEIYNHKETPEILKEAIGEVASINIRHFATLAGNIANASPAGDTIVIDYLLDAKIKLVSKKGVRIVPAKDFVLGIRKIDRHSDELITEIIFPKQNYKGYMWYKVGSRKADSIAKVTVAGIYKVDGEKIVKFALAFGSVAITVRRSLEIEKEIESLTVKELKARKEEFLAKYNEIISPIDDQRSNKEYRRKVAMNICSKFIDEVTEVKR